ncbi:RNI-like protein [Glarea lozoyensis ATCC 20868]|uniref:RNI-like protein n=1 Tax=Glarea lozoyensis (strain ATCC 20868 / MF5171) TaxID=1116229 RepID=S3DE42_GLAL2|nr:RNI-like protein [Glarea lozoyensis ATCC 20868]EPE24918.1 RNI-like protein [Glarea lozoyensis ATCC 20868]
MKWFRKKKSKSLGHADAPVSIPWDAFARSPLASSASGRLVAQLPPKVLQCIFAHVCPHARDESFESSEGSAVEDTCPLCDLRDLAHCARVSRRWREVAGSVLYHSIRIDAVHYCPLEDILAEKRKRRTKLNRNAEPEDTARARLILLSRTLREYWDTYALRVQYLKTPYMTRETCKPDLARTVAVCPNLRYLDLPEGFFTDDLSCQPLRLELQSRCPDIRKMAYKEGSEKNLELLVTGTLWRNLEVLELSRLNMDPSILRQALGRLPQLHAIKVTDMEAFNDRILQHNDYLPPFPALKELLLENVPNITVEGMTAWLQRRDVQHTLKTLSFTETGVHPTTLKPILDLAPILQNLTIVESVSTSLPAGIPPLSSKSLRTFHYEITASASTSSYNNTTSSYYNYLTSSLLSRGLPNLRELYVRDPDFPESLIGLAPPTAPFQSDPSHVPQPYASSPTQNRLSSNNPFANMVHARPVLRQELEVYSKGLDEMEWNFSKVEPPRGHNRSGSASAPRPISSYGLSDSIAKPWAANAGARKSIIVGNGFGGLLKVPSEDGRRPSSSAGERGKRGSQMDMWR